MLEMMQTIGILFGKIWKIMLLVILFLGFALATLIVFSSLMNAAWTVLRIWIIVLSSLCVCGTANWLICLIKDISIRGTIDNAGSPVYGRNLIEFWETSVFLTVSLTLLCLSWMQGFRTTCLLLFSYIRRSLSVTDHLNSLILGVLILNSGRLSMKIGIQIFKAATCMFLSTN